MLLSANGVKPSDLRSHLARHLWQQQAAGAGVGKTSFGAEALSGGLKAAESNNNPGNKYGAEKMRKNANAVWATLPKLIEGAWDGQCPQPPPLRGAFALGAACGGLCLRRRLRRAFASAARASSLSFERTRRGEIPQLHS